MRPVNALLLASTMLAAAPAFAQDVLPAPDAAADSAEIIVFGRGETRQVQEIQSRDIVTLTPGTNALKAIEKLPSVNFQSADPFGNYEWSQRVTIRSFNQNQLGFTFDGIPLGDMSYGNHNGLHITRAISSENIGSVRVSQGAGSLGTQATGNLGGTVETFSMDPTGAFGAQGNLTYGSNDTIRAFGRIDMGSADGIRGYVSYGYGSTDKYKGQGVQDQHMGNAKVIIPIGEAKIDGWLSYSDRREQDYQDMSMGMIRRLGWDWDNTYPDYARAIDYASRLNDVDLISNSGGSPFPDGRYDYSGATVATGQTYPGNVTSADDAYYDAAGLRKDWLGAIGFTTPLGETASFKIKGYYHNNSGMGLWATPYVPSPNGVPMSVRTTEYEMDRIGAFGSVDYTLGIQNLSVGAWYENNKFNQARRFYAFASRTEPGLSFRDYPQDPFATQWEFDFTTDTFQYHVQDKIDLGMVTINLGWKGFKVTNEAEAVVSSSFPEGKIKVEDWFQPHAGFAVELTPEAEIFGGFTQVTRAFASATTTGPFSTNQTGFDAIKDDLKPETSDTFELGLRYNTPVFNGTVGAYLVNFRNRLLAVQVGSAIQGNPSALQNVGGVRAIGVEAAGDLKLGGGFGLYASYSYTDATYRDDVVNGDGTLVAAIKDKTVVDSPKHMARGELNYDDGQRFFRVGLNYMSRRYYSYTNDASVPGRLIVDASLGYRFTDKVEIQLNATNLFDKRYVGTIGSGGFGNSGDAQTLLVGAPQQFFATLKTGF
ncbi:MAG TPA: TonB-dependent receptor [Sphingobium sp.]|jgi:iron complex outermembrane receptor protein|uniref:TonB-dependent receptor n=1 Tax=unclassified Sphingobium TaxID=2611147 RepID=UPI0007F441F4|nr:MULTISPECIES: TonB-dependent receptor [unclassified Sphingobium]OAN57666.1 TonB-dependent receptor [Sphingobium sp. TCM1]HAF41805.1 TonB-dependent receptor [Sphingobium sp.]